MGKAQPASWPFLGPVSLARGLLPTLPTMLPSSTSPPRVLLRICIPWRWALSSLLEPSGRTEVTNHFIPSSCCCCHPDHFTAWFLMSVPSFRAFVEFDPRLNTGRVFILPDKVPIAERFGTLAYCTCSPSRWGCNYNITVWVQLKVRKRYIKFAHMLFSYPHPATFQGGVCVYACVYTQSRYNSHFAKFMQKPNTWVQSFLKESSEVGALCQNVTKIYVLSFAH